MKTTGEKIKSLRIALGLSQEQLSETIDVAHKSIYRYETGKSLPDTTTLVKLATYFDVSTDYCLRFLLFVGCCPAAEGLLRLPRLLRTGFRLMT